jgi:hypothetical protein
MLRLFPRPNVTLSSNGLYGPRCYLLHLRAGLLLDSVEFRSLPSGLHLVEKVVMLVFHSPPLLSPRITGTSRKTPRGAYVSLPVVRSPRKTSGFTLFSIGVFAPSVRPRPWHHVPALKSLVRDLQFDSESTEDIWEPARWFFELRKAPETDLGAGTDAWHRWSEEFDDAVVDDGSDGSEVSPAISKRVSSLLMRQ